MVLHQSAVFGKGTKLMKCTLDEILKYDNRPVVARFEKDFPNFRGEGGVIFKDLLRFFWASEKHEQDRKADSKNKHLDFVFIMDEAMKPIDQIWHVFLLYTKDYMDFCHKYFQEYIHHLPDIVPNMKHDEEKFEINLNRFLNYNYDLLGEEVIKRWFGEK